MGVPGHANTLDGFGYTCTVLFQTISRDLPIKSECNFKT